MSSSRASLAKRYTDASPPGSDPRKERREARHLRLVDPPAKRKAAGWPGRRRSHQWKRVAIGAYCALLVVVLFGVAGAHALIASDQVRLGSLEAKEASLQATHDHLAGQVVERSAPGNVLRAAEGSLHMVPPAGVTYLSPVPVGAPVGNARPRYESSPKGSAGQGRSSGRGSEGHAPNSSSRRPA